MKVLFEEKQYFRQKWIWLVVLFFPIFSIYGIFEQFIMHRPIGNHPISDAGLTIYAILFGLGLPLLLYYTHLKVYITQEGLYYRFFPFHFKEYCIKKEEIEKVEALTYSPLKEYGGWGIRYGFKGKAYNVSGNLGVKIHLKNDSNILFGSQNHKQMEKVLRTTITN